jgi:S1-C subfamily serine protease
VPDDLTPPPVDPNDRQRRATDGLNWLEPRPLIAPEPAPLLDVPPPPVDLPASQFSPVHPARRTGFVTSLATHSLAAVLGGLLAGAVIVLLVGDRDTPTVQPQPAGPRTTLTVEETSAIVDAAAKGRPSVVRIESQSRIQGGVATDVGSGIILDVDGHILTNAHVVLNTDSVTVFLADGTSRPAVLLGNDSPFTDLAVLQIPPGNLTPMEIGDSSSLKLGESVVAIGNPLGEFDGSVTMGVISGLNRSRNFDAVRQDDLIQTDAAINNGNSGGALLNLHGQFVGMPTAILRQAPGGDTAPVEGIAFVLPANRLIPIAQQIISSGGYPRPSLGVTDIDLSPDIRVGRVSLSDGALVQQVARGGPADAAGIQAGDVITKIGDNDVNRQNPLLNALQPYAPGQTVRVVLNRNGRIIEVEVRLAKKT